PQKHSWTARRIPELADFAWREYQPDLPAYSWIQLFPGERKLHVVQSLQIRGLQGSIERLLLRVPPELAERDEDGNMTWRVELVGENGKRVWMSGQGPRLRLETKSDAAPTGLTLRYVVNLPAEKTGDGAHVPA